VVRARRILAGCDDRKVHSMVTFSKDPSANVRRDLSFGPTDEGNISSLQLSCDAIHRVGCSPKGLYF